MITTAPTVHLTRTIAAPRSRVYRAWLDPELLQRWMFAGDNIVKRAEVDERPGGRYRIFQANAAGEDTGGFESEIVELVEDERIVLRWGFTGPDRSPDPAHDSQLTVTFAEAPGGATELTLVHERLDGLHAAMPEVTEKVSIGWELALEKLPAAVGAA